MHYVYLIQSANNRGQHYAGQTGSARKVFGAQLPMLLVELSLALVA
jgi:hypothetical protein